MAFHRNPRNLLPTLVSANLLLLANLFGVAKANEQHDGYAYDLGGIVRGETTQKHLSLIFTGGEFGEGCDPILDTLDRFGIKASFFVTGDFLRQPGLDLCLRRITSEGHYLGPHSDTHPLYCPWDDRYKTLVTREFFLSDLEMNISDLRRFGALPPGQTVYFIPPYEWFNQDQANWSRSVDVILFNFTAGSGSNRDWAPRGHSTYASSDRIIADILNYERSDPRGLNGFLLLFHLGADREDKVYLQLGKLIEQLTERGYSFVRVDDLLSAAK
jgi:peptidoglycan/xylan/chitin deacetylase (PgdA/CDA1 family)